MCFYFVLFRDIYGDVTYVTDAYYERKLHSEMEANFLFSPCREYSPCHIVTIK